MRSDAGKSHSPSEGFSSASLLARMPAFAIFYALLILPFLPDDGKGRVENIMFWPLMAILTLTLFFKDRARVDSGFFRSLPIASLIAYLVFAAASATWAHNPELSLQPTDSASAGLDRDHSAERFARGRQIRDSGRVSLLCHCNCCQRCLCADDSTVSNRSSRVFYSQTRAGPACRDRHHHVGL